MTTKVAFMPDNKTIIELKLDDYIICGVIYKLRANVTQDEMADTIAEDVKLLMANDPEQAYARLQNETVSDFEDEIWNEDYVNGQDLDPLGPIHENDDGSLNYFEYKAAGQCSNAIRKYLLSLKDRNDSTLVNSNKLIDALTKVLDIWDQHSINKPISGETRQEVSDLFDQINNNSNYPDMSADAIAEDYLEYAI